MDENEVVRSLGRLEGKVDMLIDMHKADALRLTSAEKKIWYHTGALGLAVLFIVPKMRAVMGL